MGNTVGVLFGTEGPRSLDGQRHAAGSRQIQRTTKLSEEAWSRVLEGDGLQRSSVERNRDYDNAQVGTVDQRTNATGRGIIEHAGARSGSSSQSTTILDRDRHAFVGNHVRERISLDLTRADLDLNSPRNASVGRKDSKA